MRDVDLFAVGVDVHEQQPLLLLREVAGLRRLLPIWVGLPEANAIELERQHAQLPRPMTHQLLGQIVESFDRRLEQVCITSLRAGLFHAELIFDSGVRVSSRASDAVAVALHQRAPIRVEDSVLDEAGLSNAQVVSVEQAEETMDAVGQAEELEEFRRFLDTTSPEDFDTG
jgi:bifunctional DNase/RNase